MTRASKRLILAGFYKDNFLKDYPGWNSYDEKKKKQILDAMSEEKAESYADHDVMELQKEQMVLMDYPKTQKRYYLIYESPHESIEPIYYWMLDHITAGFGYAQVDKITDIFTAAEHSSFYGAAAQRLGLAQDKVSQYLATIGKMIKDMFQLVRELRWLDERKKYYEDADKGLEGAEIALKGLWTDMVDGVVGGQRTSSNIFVMAQQLQFAALPDLFFSIHVSKNILSKWKGKSPESITEEQVRKLIDELVEKQAAGFNKELRNILKRKLYQYVVWKNETWKEIRQRRIFTLDYLRQHYQVIKMYMNWVKPYLKHIQKLGADVSKLSSPELIAAFEGSLIEIEFLAQKLPSGNKKYYSCVLVTFQYRTKPQLSFAQEGGFHRGPLHVGETKIFLRSYAWTKEQIEAYKKMKDDEDMELIKSIDASLKSAMEALGEDLEKYLAEAAGMHEEKKKEEKPAKRPGIFEPFKEIGKGFGTTFSSLFPKKKKPALTPVEKGTEIFMAGNEAANTIWQSYKNFKKSRRIPAW